MYSPLCDLSVVSMMLRRSLALLVPLLAIALADKSYHGYKVYHILYTKVYHGYKVTLSC